MTKLDDMLFDIKMDEFASESTGCDDEKGCEACATCGVPTDWAQQLAHHEAQDGLLSQAQDEVARLRAELAEVQRPLDAQMARLNENLTAANARIAELAADSERLDWLQFHGARVAWSNDDEVCNVVWCDREGSYYTALFNNWRDAIDAAMNNQFKEIV